MKDSQGIYSRSYPRGTLFGHPVGYSFTSTGQTELEAFYNHELAGGASSTDDVLEQLVGSRNGGDDLQTTLDPGAQKLATDLITPRTRTTAARRSCSTRGRARSR